MVQYGRAVVCGLRIPAELISMDQRNITVFCSSSNKVDRRYFEVAEQMGRCLADRNLTLVYGGGDVGLMGTMARSVHAHGGRVVGVIPSSLSSIEGIAYDVADELIVTETMSERKQIMSERADGFVVLPGGIGTLEEFLEVITLKKLGYHDRPVALVNTAGFFDGLLEFFSRLETEHFLGKNHHALFETIESPVNVFDTGSFRHLK